MPTSPSSPSPERSPGSRTWWRRLGAAAVIVAVGAGCYAVADAWGRRAEPAELVVPQDVPDDVAAELDIAWARFVDRFGGRRDCFGDVTVLLVRQVAGGDARYVADDAVVEIEIPTTPARFRESVVHELAHHVEATCPRFQELRAELHPLLGPGHDWSDGAVWYDVPAERFAEHVVELVNGERVRHVAEIPIDARVTGLIAAWGRGEPTTPGSSEARETGRVLRRGPSPTRS